MSHVQGRGDLRPATLGRHRCYKLQVREASGVKGRPRSIIWSFLVMLHEECARYFHSSLRPSICSFLLPRHPTCRGGGGSIRQCPREDSGWVCGLHAEESEAFVLFVGSGSMWAKVPLSGLWCLLGPLQESRSIERNDCYWLFTCILTITILSICIIASPFAPSDPEATLLPCQTRMAK